MYTCFLFLFLPLVHPVPVLWPPNASIGSNPSIQLSNDPASLIHSSPNPIQPSLTFTSPVVHSPAVHHVPVQLDTSPPPAVHPVPVQLETSPPPAVHHVPVQLQTSPPPAVHHVPVQLDTSPPTAVHLGPAQLDTASLPSADVHIQPLSLVQPGGIQISYIGKYGVQNYQPQNQLDTLYYGKTPKCETVYEEREEEVTDTECSLQYKQVCNDEESCSCDHIVCPIIDDCRPEYKEQCTIVYKKKCYKKYKTFYHEECTYVYEDLCTTIIVTKFVDKCTTEYNKCAGYGYPAHCTNTPQESCTSVPVTKEVEKCAQVPRQSCRRIPVRKPNQICTQVPVRECTARKERCTAVQSTCKQLEECTAECTKCYNTPVKDCKQITKIVPVKVPVTLCNSDKITFL